MLILFADAHMVVIIIVLTNQSSELTREVNVLQALTDSKIEDLVNGIEEKIRRITFKSARSNGITIIANSAVGVANNTVSLSVSGKNISLTNTRGLNVAVVDTKGAVSDIQAFDTDESEQQSKKFVPWAKKVPTNVFFVITVKETCGKHFSSDAREMLTLFGSRQVYNVGNHDSFCMMGFKGATSGSIAEQTSSNAPCEVHCHLQPEFAYEPHPKTVIKPADENSIGFSILLASAGYNVGNKAHVAINGTIIGSCTRGINVIEINEAPNIPILKTFDTFESTGDVKKFAEYVESLIPGQRVAIVACDECTYRLTDRARRAAGSLGSLCVWNLKYRDSWVLLGRKGSPPGSVPEQISSTAALGLSELVRPYVKYSDPACTSSIYSLEKPLVMENYFQWKVISVVNGNVAFESVQVPGSFLDAGSDRKVWIAKRPYITDGYRQWKLIDLFNGNVAVESVQFPGSYLDAGDDRKVFTTDTCNKPNWKLIYNNNGNVAFELIKCPGSHLKASRDGSVTAETPFNTNEQFLEEKNIDFLALSKSHLY